MRTILILTLLAALAACATPKLGPARDVCSASDEQLRRLLGTGGKLMDFDGSGSVTTVDFAQWQRECGGG